MVFARGEDVVGGFQLLTKPWKGRLQIGYVSKGPVISDPSLQDAVVGALKALTRRQAIPAIVVQAPDRGILASRNLEEDGFHKASGLLGVIENTLVNELPADSEPLKASLRKSTRYGVNRAMREGVTIEFGRRDDLPEFFNLMQETCRRQQVSPNPGSVEALQAMWDGFGPRGQLELTFAVWEGGDSPVS